MKILSIVGILVALVSFNATAEDLRVGIKNAKPFAYQENGVWKGLSVDLIEQLSKDQNFKYKFVPAEDIGSLIDDVKTSNVDLSLAAISVTYERERFLDFSQPYFTTSLGILSKDKSTTWDNIIWIGKQLVFVLAGFITLLYIVGIIMNKVDGDENIDNNHDGAWWALVTFTTTGYGDLVPKTNKGKFIASIWMISSIFLLSLFTGYMASAMTVKRLSESPDTLADLYKAKVAVISNSTAQGKLNGLNIRNTGVKNLDAALKLFKSGKVNTIVYDEAMLKYMASDMESVTVYSIDNSEENYAVALPSNSSLTEQINLGILNILGSQQWKTLQLKYNVL